MPDSTEFSGRPVVSGPRSALLVGLLVIASIALAIAQPWSAPAPQSAASPAALASVAPAATDATNATATPAASPTAEGPAPVAMAPFTLVAPPRGASWSSIRWQPIDPTIPLAHLGKAVRWRGGYASLGDDGRGGTQLWASADGAVWQPILPGTATTFWPGVRVEAVAPLGRRLLAVSSLPAALQSVSPPSPDPAAADPNAPLAVVLSSWLSDDGVGWQLRGGPIFARPIRLSGSLVAAGAAGTSGAARTTVGTAGVAVIGWNEWPEPGGQATGHLAVTSDGASWRQVPDGELPSGFQVMDVAAAPAGGFLAAGKSITDGLASVALLRSDATALRWVPVALPQALLSVDERATVVWRLEAGARGVLAIGDSAARELWWWSADGRDWTAVGDFRPVGASGCPGSNQACGAYADGLLTGDGDRVVAVGGNASNATMGAWASADAAQWRHLGERGTVPRDRPTAAVLLPGGIVVLGGGGAWYGEATAGP